MSGTEFERRIALLFEDLGYRVRLTKTTGDFGADLVVTRRSEVMVVQTKRYATDHRVGVSAVQEVVAAAAVYGARSSMVVTNAHFTRAAQTLARANSVDLCDRESLIRMLAVARGATTKPAETTEQPWWKQTPPSRD